MIGSLLTNRYRIDDKLGEGGMGIVYKAHDTLLNRTVAVKALTPALLSPDGVARLLREAQAAAQLTHPNIVSVYDVLEDSEARLIVMEYVEGQTLAQLVPQDAPRAVDLLTQVCRALQYAHGRGIIHRDIKPENIVVTSDGIAKVMDFGLARSEGRTKLTQTGLIVGTVAYMAPEQILGGTVDARTDLYSLGCVAYELLTGRRPFEGDDAFTILSQHVNVAPVAPRWHNSTVPPTLDAIVMRLLAKDPAERYPSAEDVILALEMIGEAETEAGGAQVEAATRTTLLERIVRGKLVGREKEIRELREHLDRMLSGEGRLVLISGEPGIGKTRLADELAVYAHLRGSRVLRGHCYEQEIGVPYLPFVESLRQLLHESERSTLDALGEVRDDLARLLPEIGPKGAHTAPLTPEDERTRLLDAVSRWVGQASRTQPFVFLVDDLHWADRASLRLMHHVARHLREHRILLIGTYREMELDLEHPLNDTLSQMNRERLFYRLPLRRLTEDDTRAMLSGLFDTDISTELAGAVYHETEGNPFFIEEVVKALVEEGKIYREAGRWQRLEIEQLEIPQSVKAAIGRRVQKASEPARRVLTIAAVIGREFNPDVLVKVTDLTEDTVLDAIDEATRLQLIREIRIGKEVGYTFEHALIRQTLYDGLNARRRARLHQHVGEALETLYARRLEEHIEAIAYHFGEAGATTAEKGIAYNLQAARKAASIYAMEEAERRLTIALELAESQDDTGVQATVLEALGDLYLQFSDHRSITTYQRALTIIRTNDGERSADALRLSLRVAEASAGWWMEAPTEALLYAQAAVDRLKEEPDTALKARAFSLLAMHRARAGEIDAARSAAEAAVAIAKLLIDRNDLSLAYRAMAMVHRYANEWDHFREIVRQRRSLLGEALVHADVDLYVDLIQGYLTESNYEAAERVAREFVELAEKIRSPRAQYRGLTMLAYALYGNNKWDEALQTANRLPVLAQRYQLAGYFGGRGLNISGYIAVHRGDLEQARHFIERLNAIPSEVPPEHSGPREFALNIALVLDDRNVLVQQLPKVESERPRCQSCALTFDIAVGRTRVRLSDREGALSKLREAQQAMSAEPVPTDRIDLIRFAGEVAELEGRRDDAIQHFDEALRIAASLPANVLRADIYTDAARILLARNTPADRDRAGALLPEAIDIYQVLKARASAERARSLLESASS